MTLQDTYVSTGHLPPPDEVQALVEEAHERYRANAEGATSDVYPALARVPAGLFGLCVAGTSGNVYAAGDSEVEFSIMSVSKPFVFALVCQLLGPETARDRLGVNSTGLPFNSLTAVEQGDGRTNPMVNSGAIATTSLVPGGSAESKWTLHPRRPLPVRRPYAAAERRGLRVRVGDERPEPKHRASAPEPRPHLQRPGRGGRPVHAAVLPERQREDLAAMAATLADGGVNPLTGERVVDETTCRHALAVMATAGLYETSGDWLYDIGLPGKSGIGGGIVTVAPGKGGFGTFAPPLDAAGNSVRGQLAAAFLSRRLGLDLFVSEPVA